MHNMAGVWCLAQLPLLWFAALFPASESRLIQVPQSHRPAGVFLHIEGESYTFNFTAARDACQFLNVTIATREQMERALQQGLETCKFGWTAEQVAVIPRLTPVTNCGGGKTGLVLWRASPDRKFGVFCFSASDSQETPSTSKAAPHMSTSSPPTLTPLTQTSAPATALITSSTATRAASSPRPTAKEATERTTTLPPGSIIPVQTARSTATSSSSSTTSSMKTSPTQVHTSLSHRSTLKPTDSVSAAFSTSVSELQLLEKSTRPHLGALPITLIILGVVLLLLTAAGVVWYHRPNIFTFWSPGQQKDDTETEMWKHVDSDMDLHSQHGAEEDDDDDDDDEYEESDRKYSSDITLCVNPHMKTMCQ